jgi:hypothetical protein
MNIGGITMITIRKVLLSAVVAVLSLAGAAAQSDGAKLGEVKKVDRRSGEIIVSLPASANDIKIGDLLYTRVNGSVVLLRATFPMQTLVKCRAEGKNSSLLTSAGSTVYRYTKEIENGTAVKPADSTKVYVIGDRGPGNGFVFYDKGVYSDGWRYLEAAPEDQDLTATWHNNDKNVETGATGILIGTGKDNTRKIIATQGEGVYAAKLCADYRGGGKSDWFLPSKDELDMMYMKLKKTGIVDFSGRFAWTSSEDGIKKAYFQAFMFGYNSSTVKSDQGRVRAVRAF